MAIINYDLKSTTLLNAIKADATDTYKERIPTATIDNLAKVGTAILNWESTRNDFAQALFNRIGKMIITSKMYNNPLAEFKKGMLEYGQTIEEVFVDLAKENLYDPATAESEVYKRDLPDLKSIFHNINRTGFYKTTVQREDLKLAFTGEQGMMNLIDKIIQTLYTSDSFDEFIYMKNLIGQYGNEGKFAMVSVTAPTDTDTAKVAMTTIKQYSNNLTFMSNDYNHAQVRTHTVKEDQIVLISTAFDALVDVEVLASAFNMDKADFIGRRVLVDDFGGLDNVVCAIVDKAWFMVYDKLIESESIYNPQGLYYNYFLHHHQVLSTSIFANAILFVSVTPTISAINVLPATATVPVGTSVQLNIEVTGTYNAPSKCTYTHNGTAGVTTINSMGLVTVGASETVSPLTVTATSVFNDSISDTCVITVV